MSGLRGRRQLKEPIDVPEISTIGALTAFGAGIVSFLSPCVLPLVPATSPISPARRWAKPDARAAARGAARQPRTQSRRKRLAAPPPVLSLQPGFEDYEAILDACCAAWNALTGTKGKIRSITSRKWATLSVSGRFDWYKIGCRLRE